MLLHRITAYLATLNLAKFIPCVRIFLEQQQTPLVLSLTVLLGTYFMRPEVS
jgi:hypothetical protein